MRSTRPRSICRPPTASISTRTRSPARARSARASANASAGQPCQYTKVIRSTVRSAARIASSIAGKISTPLCRTVTAFPSVKCTPISASRVRRRRWRDSSRLSATPADGDPSGLGVPWVPVGSAIGVIGVPSGAVGVLLPHIVDLRRGGRLGWPRG